MTPIVVMILEKENAVLDNRELMGATNPKDAEEGTIRKKYGISIDQKFKRVNGANDVSVDVRLICSSSKDLKKEIEIGNFREDLFHRINVFEINIEPLSQRISDIPLLIKYFSKKISENYKIKVNGSINWLQ